MPVENLCSSFSPHKIRAAIKTVSDKEDCTHNVTVSDLEASDQENREQEVFKLFPVIEEIRNPDSEPSITIKFTSRSSKMVKRELGSWFEANAKFSSTITTAPNIILFLSYSVQ